MQKIILSLFMLFIFINNIKAQNKRTINGVVTDNVKEPISGVTVIVKGTIIGTITGASGEYLLEVPRDAEKLVFSFIGMTTKEIKIGDKTTIDVQLNEDAIAIDEIVAVGYSVKKKLDLTGSVGVVNMKDIKSMPVAGIDQAFQGRVSGVNVISSGSPGGNVVVRIRGYGTTGDNDPLYIVDGVPTKTGINMINPEDIESFQVLKDAASAAVYGARAGNGVIIVTTKKGNSEDSKISLNAYSGIKSVSNSRFPEMASPTEYAKMLYVAQKNSGIESPTHQQFKYDENGNVTINDYLAGVSNIEANKTGTDWVNEMFETGKVNNVSLDISKGNKDGFYNMSLSHYNEQGVILHSKFKRFTGRLNSLHSFFNNKVKIGENFSGSFSKKKGSDGDIGAALRMPSVVPIRDTEGNFAGPGNGLGDADNAIAALYRKKDNYSQNIKIFGDIYLETELFKNLFFKTNIGIDNTNYKNFEYNASYIEGNNKNEKASIQKIRGNEFSYVWSNTLRYSLQLKEKHNFDFLAGTEFISSSESYLIGYGDDYFDESIDNLYISFADGNQIASDFGASSKLFSYFGKLDYDYNHRYLLSLTIRQDASSRFAKENRDAIFPAFSAGWRLSNEDFFNVDMIKNLKFRFSWGQTGNQEIGNYAYCRNYVKHNVLGTGGGSVANYYLSGTNWSNGLILNKNTYEGIKWETTTQTNVGLDLGLSVAKHSFDLTADYFVKRTSDMLAEIEIPYTAGGTSDNPTKNIGEVENKGMEIGVSFKSNPNKNLRFNSDINLTFLKNKVIDLDGNEYQGSGVANGDPVTITKEGAAISSFYGYQVEGIFKSQEEIDNHATQEGAAIGRLKYKNVDGDNEITDKDRTIIGNPHPDYLLSMRFGVEYKSFDFGIFLNGTFGNDIYNVSLVYSDFATNNFNKTKEAATNYWSSTNTNASVPAPSTSNSNNETYPSSYFVQDGSYLRIQNIQLGYNVPKEILSNLYISQLRIYAQIQNLHTFTNYEGLEPEISAQADNLNIGIDEGNIYPNPTTFTIGLNLSF